MAAVASNTSTPYGRAFDNVNLPKHDINTLVMDFLIQEGYPAAAAHFAEEANIDMRAENSLIEERVSIRDAIFRGDLETAIEEINAIDTQLLDNDKSLLFSLLRLQLIELIKQIPPAPESEKPALVGAALTFAQQNLSPYAPQNDKFKTDLERAMALMIVPAEAWCTPRNQNESQNNAFGPLWELVDPSLKVEVARDVNAAILKHQGRKEQSKIHKILQTRAWSETLAREKLVKLPRDLKVTLQDTPADTQSQHGNGDTQMTEDADEATRDVEHRYTNIHESSR